MTMGAAPDFDKLLEKLGEWPWKATVWVMTGAFLSAFGVSMFVNWYFAPSAASLKQTISSNIASQTIDPSLTQGGRPALNNSDVDAILKRNIFNSEGKLGDLDPVEGAENGDSTTTAQLVKSELPIKVIGIIYGGSPYIGLVTIENTQKKRINSFVVGDAIQNDAKIAEIRRDRIIIDRAGRKEFAMLEEFKIERSKRKKKSKQPAGGSNSIAAIASGPPPESFKEEGFERDGGTIRMTAEYKNRIIGEDMTKTLQDAKAEPNIDKETGQLRGFRLTRIREGSIYQKSGLQNDDIVEEINGVALNNTAGAINLLQSLKGENSVEVRINRGGTTMTFTLSVN